MMNLIEYKAIELKKYEADIWQSGLCPGLAKIKPVPKEAPFRLAEGGSGDRERCTDGAALSSGLDIVWDGTGHTNIADHIKPCGRAGVTDGFFKLLRAFRKITEAQMAASEYLIEPARISLDSSRLWFSSASGCAALLPAGCGEEGGFVERLAELARFLNAPELAARLEESNSESLMAGRDILRLLSLWELELR